MSQRTKTVLKFIITLDGPPKHNVAMVQGFIFAALKHYKSTGVPPQHPMSKLDTDTLRIALHARQVTYS